MLRRARDDTQFAARPRGGYAKNAGRCAKTPAADHEDGVQGWLVLVISAAYVAALFLLAWWGERRAQDRGPMAGALVYCLTLAVYNTSWSFYGSVGRAATSGLDFLTIYVGPTLVLLLGRPLLGRVIALAKAQNATSIADFIAARYGKSQALAALVTLTALLGVLPYIALQLKAVGTSFDLLAGPPGPGARLPFWQDSAFATAAAMALFAIVFGVRHIHASEHHRGLMLAIAFESLVKLAAFLAVALLITFGIADGPRGLAARLAADPALNEVLAFDLARPAWLSNTLIAAIAFLCLPQAFHVAVVENQKPQHVRTAAWLYPAYLLAFSLFMPPIALAGRSLLGPAVNPDTYMIALPLAGGVPSAALLAFIGGLSAATGMVIVATVALSTMLCNDVIMPLALRWPLGGRQGPAWPVAAALLKVRRVAVVAILLFAYLMHRLVDQAYPLTLIGLVSFVAVAQFGPAFFGGLLWRRANHAGAVCGILVGFAFWAYTLLLPSIAPLWPAADALVHAGPWAIAWLRPQALFGLTGLDPISQATLWSLGGNGLVFVLLSLLRGQSAAERSQAALFTSAPAGAMVAAPQGRAVMRFDDLRLTAARFVGAERASAAFESYLAGRRAGQGPRLDASGLVDLDSVRFTENLVAGAIGGASARVVMASSLESRSLSRRAAMAMLDEASQALHFNRKLLEGALESIPQGICVFDAELRITAWNGRFLQRLGLPGDVIRVGFSLAELVDFNRGRGEYDADDLKALLVNRDLAAQTWPYVYERQRPDGTVLEIVYDRMAAGGYVSTYTDVTERHQAAAALRRANEDLEERVRERTQALEQAKAAADEANAGKTRFLAAASHDLLQPLNAARLFLAALDEKLAVAGASAPEQRSLAANAATALRSTEELLDALLDISAYDAGAVQAEVAPFAIADLFARLELEFSALAQRRGLTLRVVPSRLAVRSDAALLRRILQNLLSNAIRYTPSGRVLLGCRRRGAMLCLEVWDTGIGIAPERQAEIFGEFVQLQPRDGGEKGAGLGLAIVERIARLLGHPIELGSRPGRGSCFAVSLPLAPHPVPVPVGEEGAVSPAFAAQALTVLCVDDDETILAGLAALLGSWGHRAVIAASPAAALALDAHADALIVDHHLGEGPTGLDLAQTLYAKAKGGLPVLVATADRGEAVRRAVRERGFEMLYKPVKPAALRRFLNGVALRRRVQAQEELSA